MQEGKHALQECLHSGKQGGQASEYGHTGGFNCFNIFCVIG